MKKLLSILSLASIATTVFTTPAIAEPMVHYGKGTYTVDNGTYRGCLYSGGCIFLGRKYLLKDNNPESEGIDTSVTRHSLAYPDNRRLPD